MIPCNLSIVGSKQEQFRSFLLKRGKFLIGQTMQALNGCL